MQLQLQLDYITQRYTTLITLHYATATTATTTTTTTRLHIPHAYMKWTSFALFCAYKVGFRSPLYTPTMGNKAVSCARSTPLDLEDGFIQRWLSSLPKEV